MSKKMIELAIIRPSKKSEMFNEMGIDSSDYDIAPGVIDLDEIEMFNESEPYTSLRFKSGNSVDIDLQYRQFMEVYMNMTEERIKRVCRKIN